MLFWQQCDYIWVDKTESQLNQLGQKVVENKFKVFKEKLFFESEGKIKTFPHKQNWKNLLLVHVSYEK